MEQGAAQPASGESTPAHSPCSLSGVASPGCAEAVDALRPRFSGSRRSSDSGAAPSVSTASRRPSPASCTRQCDEASPFRQRDAPSRASEASGCSTRTPSIGASVGNAYPAVYIPGSPVSEINSASLRAPLAVRVSSTGEEGSLRASSNGSGSVASGRSTRRARSAAFRYSSLAAYEQGGYLTKPDTAKHCVFAEFADAGLTVGVAGMQGWRKTMEDAHFLAPAGFSESGGLCAGVLDGHAGATVSQLLARAAPEQLCLNWDKLDAAHAPAGPLASAVQELFLELDRGITAQAPSGGSTGVVALLARRRAVIAHCGDARAVLCREGGRALPLTRDHKPADPGEKQRVELSGGRVEDGRISIPGVQGTLAVSRAFGDAPFKHQPCSQAEQPVSAAADVCVVDLHPADRFLLLACDGIWERLSEQEAVDFVSARLGETEGAVSAERAAEVCGLLCDSCLAAQAPGRGCDNMTALLVLFGRYEGPPPTTLAAETTDSRLLTDWEEYRTAGKLDLPHVFRLLGSAFAVEDPMPDTDDCGPTPPGTSRADWHSGVPMESAAELNAVRSASGSPQPSSRCTVAAAPAADVASEQSSSARLSPRARSSVAAPLPGSAGQKDVVYDASRQATDNSEIEELAKTAPLLPALLNTPSGTPSPKRGSLLREHGVLAHSLTIPGSPVTAPQQQQQQLSSPKGLGHDSAMLMSPSSSGAPGGSLQRKPPGGILQALQRNHAAECDVLLSPHTPLHPAGGRLSVSIAAREFGTSQSQQGGGAGSPAASPTGSQEDWEAAAQRSPSPAAARRAALLLPLAATAAAACVGLAAACGAGGAPAAAAVYGFAAAACVVLGACPCSAKGYSAAAFEFATCYAAPTLALAADIATAASGDAWALAIPFVVAAQLGARPLPAAAAAALAAAWALFRTLDESRGGDAWLGDLADSAAVARRYSPEWVAAAGVLRCFAVGGAALSAGCAVRQQRSSDHRAAAVVSEIVVAARRCDAAALDRIARAIPEPELRKAAADLAATLRDLFSCVPDGLLQRGDFDRQSHPFHSPASNTISPLNRPKRRSAPRDSSASNSGAVAAWSNSGASPRDSSDLSGLSGIGTPAPGVRFVHHRNSSLSASAMDHDRRVSTSSTRDGQAVTRRASSLRSSISEGAATALRRLMHSSFCEDWGRPREAAVLQVELDTESAAASDLTRAAGVFVCGAQTQVHRHGGTSISVTGTQMAFSWNAHKICATPAEQACRCVFSLMRALPQISNREQLAGGRLWYVMAVTCGPVNVGIVGTQDHRAALTVGLPVLQAMRLGRLAMQLQTRALLSERVYEQVRSRCAGRPVDAVHDGRGAHTSHTVYELLRGRGDTSSSALPTREDRELFIEGFVALRRELYSEGREKFLAYTNRRPNDQQAVRLLKLCSYLVKRPPPRRGSDTKRQQWYCRSFVGWDDFESRAEEALDDDVAEAAMRLLRSHASLSTTGDSDDSQSEVDALLLTQPKRDSMRHAAMLRQAIREAEAEANADELAAWGIMGSPRSQQQAKPKGLPVRFKDHKERQWQRADKCLGKGAFGEVWMGMSNEGALVAIKSMRLPLLNTMKQEVFSAKAEGDRLGSSGSGGSASTASRRRAAAARRAQGGQVSQRQPTPRERQQQQLQQIEDLLREVELMQQLQHENIVGYLASAIVGGYIMIVMEYLSGGSLQSVMQQFGAGGLSVTSVQRYLRDIVSGLIFLHFHEIVHRDLKPHNVLLLIDGQCKLADFGASAQLSEMNASTQGVIGTPLYMAPEACRGAVSKASDVWALGIILCQVFAGELPYHFSDDAPFNPQVFMYRLGNTADFGPTIPDAVPLEARELVTKCLQREPELRPAAEDIKAEVFLLA